jgi:hypothetical protein
MQHTMTKTSFFLLGWLGLSLAAHGAAPRANDYPTLERVLYVHECIAAHPGYSNYEMVSKCSCAIDAMAREVKYEDYMAMSTASKATTIAGERGGAIRDVESMQAIIKRYRARQAKVNAGCFISPGGRP